MSKGKRSKSKNKPKQHAECSESSTDLASLSLNSDTVTVTTLDPELSADIRDGYLARRPEFAIRNAFQGLTADHISIGILTGLGLLVPQAETCLKVCQDNFVECLVDLARVSAQQFMSMGLDSAHAHLLTIQVQRFMAMREATLLKVRVTEDVLQNMLAIDSRYTKHIVDVLWTVYIENMYDLLHIISTKYLPFDLAGMSPAAHTTLVLGGQSFIDEYCVFQNTGREWIAPITSAADIPKRPFVPPRQRNVSSSDEEPLSHPTWVNIRPKQDSNAAGGVQVKLKP